MLMLLEPGFFPLRGGYRDARREMRKGWLRDMCEIVRVPPRTRDNDCLEMALATNAYVIARVRADVPRAAEAVRDPSEMGYRLHTASGSDSADLHAFLGSMGIRNLFKQTYGSDLIDTWKGSHHYYGRIFADSGESPSSSLVVDDSNRSVQWATEAGASAVLIWNEPPGSTDAWKVLRSLADLPSFLAGTDV